MELAKAVVWDDVGVTIHAPLRVCHAWFLVCSSAAQKECLNGIGVKCLQFLQPAFAGVGDVVAGGELISTCGSRCVRVRRGGRAPQSTQRVLLEGR